MPDLTYNVNITWQHSYKTSATQSAGGYFVASMPEINLSATGSSQSTALSNLQTLANSGVYANDDSVSRTRYF